MLKNKKYKSSSDQNAAKMNQERRKEAANPRRVRLQARSSTDEKKSFRYLKNIGFLKTQKITQKPVILFDLPTGSDSVEPTVFRHNSVFLLLCVDHSQDSPRLSSKRVPSEYTKSSCIGFWIKFDIWNFVTFYSWWARMKKRILAIFFEDLAMFS